MSVIIVHSRLPPSTLPYPNKTVDLFEGKDIGLVVRCVFALGSAVQLTCPEYTGPSLGAKPHQVKPKDCSRCRGAVLFCPHASTCFAAKAETHVMVVESIERETESNLLHCNFFLQTWLL